ncbi:MAG: hypothetical protein RIS86_1, partial [Planctomycetota bacterium]
VQLRERDAVLVYEGEMYDSMLASLFAPQFDAATGDFIALDDDAPAAEDLPILQEIMDRLGEVTVDFADALDAANAAAGRDDAERIIYAIEAGILAYQVDYMDGMTKSYIDAATGGEIPHHENEDEAEDNVPATAVGSAIALAEATLGAGWMTIGVEVEAEGTGSIVQVLLLNLKSGMLAQADVAGKKVLSVVEFEPIGAQVDMVAEIQAASGSIVVDAAAAVAAAEAEYPGAGVNEVELEAEQEAEKGDTTTLAAWKIELTTVDLIELDFFVDATMPAGEGFRRAAAPVNGIDGDYNADGMVNAADIAELLAGWNAVNPPMDLDGSGRVDAGDLAILLANWS